MERWSLRPEARGQNVIVSEEDDSRRGFTKDGIPLKIDPSRSCFIYASAGAPNKSSSSYNSCLVWPSVFGHPSGDLIEQTQSAVLPRSAASQYRFQDLPSFQANLLACCLSK